MERIIRLTEAEARALNEKLDRPARVIPALAAIIERPPHTPAEILDALADIHHAHL